MTWKPPPPCGLVHDRARLQCHGDSVVLNEGKRGEDGSSGRRGEAVAIRRRVSKTYRIIGHVKEGVSFGEV